MKKFRGQPIIVNADLGKPVKQLDRDINQAKLDAHKRVRNGLSTEDEDAHIANATEARGQNN